GTILIMEDHNAKMNADETLMTDADGRLIAEDAVTNLFVMEKRAGWETENGHWDYAWFLPDGSRKADAKFEGCFSCHANRSGRDYNFTYSTFVSDQAM
ncbi:MAG TPA: cytochrome P460 family protein, partial [Afifellaceae bacterium]|nr:cytochrome P460 family protein [Afifellaceae bacterium]